MAYRYPAAARAFHWLTAVLVAIMFVLGLWITWFESADEAFKHQLYVLHESTGVALFFVVVLRLLRRVTAPPAPLPSRLHWVVRLAARANHALLYAVLLLQPVIGFLATNAAGVSISWAGLVPLPMLIGADKATAEALSEAHEFVALLLLLLIGAHVLGAAYHGLVRRDGVVQRML